jgi:hypothetical protein
MRITSTIKKQLALAGLCLSLVVSAGALASNASAHNSDWLWTPEAAKTQLKRDGIIWNDGQFDEILKAKCRGVGTTHLRNGVRMYRHFRCQVLTHREDVYFVKLHVRGEFDFQVDFLGY